MAPVVVLLETEFQTDDHCRLAAVGSIQELGQWNPARAALCCNHGNKQTVSFNVQHGIETFDFKWLLLDEDGNVLRWQDGENRSVTIPTYVSEMTVHVPWEGKTEIYEVITKWKWARQPVFPLLKISDKTICLIALGALGIACVAVGLSRLW